ncbi:YqjF family protein [Flavobacterium silvaticum]|uniref:DUF2071 domain-containing protein n=1 Tax=Flavobacterium silvaticum TaxID=1852020 RepID=A0A972JJ46_9FLAO|nr:DUF2071 domain-containing protein [Flavobacterium silvaticum]NMH27837.1 DUF2071 domain-containing protein [Flavobacterium silvaticum]
MERAFLKAEWRKLLMANYIVEPSLLQKYLPVGTELDLWKGNCYVSVVGFLFLNTAIKGIKIPLHVNFEEVNLRFYVRHFDKGEWKRGVVFIKEIVPRPALTFVANSVYGEKYETLPMSHKWESSSDNLLVEYAWKKRGKWSSISANMNLNQLDIVQGSDEEFITEHFWGYTRINQKTTSEYQVEHPRWRVYEVKDYTVDIDFEQNYGSDFGFLKDEKPASVFLAEGSEIKVNHGRKL